MSNKNVKNIADLLASKSARAVFMGTKLRDYFNVAAKLTGRREMDKFDELWEFTKLDPEHRIYMGFAYPDCKSRDEPNPDVTIGEMLHAAQALFRHEACLSSLEDYNPTFDSWESLRREMDNCGILITTAIFAPLAAPAMEGNEKK